ncbi:MAG: type VI secretion system ATPase TssH, partial [Bacteroidales bacterium]|nr:type VI secretion system ATPase TssH [Bacteroidales bacterium]
HFRPEFLNRLDEIILFKPLTKDSIASIVDLILAGVNKRLADQELSITLSPEAKSFVIERGYDPIYGARPLKRYVQKHIETLAAKAILGGEIAGGDEIHIALENGELKAEIRKGA